MREVDTGVRSLALTSTAASVLMGTVSEFSDVRGLGTVRAPDGLEYVFHVVEIADGTRSIDVGQSVIFQQLPKYGRVQASRLHKA